jgi:hypothetical protein
MYLASLLRLLSLIEKLYQPRRWYVKITIKILE